MARLKTSLAGAIALALVATGCTKVGPNYLQPEVDVLTNWDALESEALESQKPIDTRWWSVFDDEVLNGLIDSAVNQNLDLRTAGIRILEARARLGFARGNYWPQQQSFGAEIGAVELFEENNTPDDVDSFKGSTIDFNLNWELDFWGKFRRAIESADAELTASAADYNDVMVLLQGEVARTYVAIRTLQSRIRFTIDNIKVQERSLEITEARFRGGQVSELDVQQALILLTTTQARLPRLEADLQAQKNALSVLLAELPGSVEERLNDEKLYGQIPIPGKFAALGAPVELLRRRPDIVTAERELASQSARIGVNQADLYPHFFLNGIFGWAGGDGLLTGGDGSNDFFEPDAGFIGGFFGFRWDVFNYGRIRNRIRVEDARFQQLVDRYENTVIRAHEEVATSIVKYIKGIDETGFLIGSVKASQRAVELSTTQYVSGIADYTRVLESLRFLSTNQDQLASTEGNTVIALVTLYQALGGGWEAYQGPQVPQEIQQQMRSRTKWGNYLPVFSQEEMKSSYPSIPSS